MDGTPTRARTAATIVLSLQSFTSVGCWAPDWRAPDTHDPFVVLQRNELDCGVAAATTLFNLLGESATYDSVAALVQLGDRGLSPKDLIDVAKAFGHPIVGYFVTSRNVGDVPKSPWITLLGHASMGHYVVVRRVLGDAEK